MRIVETIEWITPQKAKEYLEHNETNYRSLQQHRVENYAEEMKNDLWQLNGESIKFREDGSLADGQHRLAAVIKAGRPVQMCVLRGLDNNVTLFDVGMGRTTGQIVRAGGGSRALSDGTICSAANMMLYGAIRLGISSTPKATLSKYLLSHSAPWEAVYKVISTNQTNGKLLSRKAPIALALYCLIRSGEALPEIDKFIQVLNSGYPDAFRESSPAIALRNYVQSVYGDSLKSRNKNNTGTLFNVFASTILAFYDFKNGVPRRKNYVITENVKSRVNALFRSVRELDGLCE